jgi:hypothetical protein
MMTLTRAIGAPYADGTLLGWQVVSTTMIRHVRAVRGVEMNGS